MAACSFDMQFTFVWAGWEGSAHDTRIFYEAIEIQSYNFHGHWKVFTRKKKYGCCSAGLICFYMKYFVSVNQFLHLCKEVLSR